MSLISSLIDTVKYPVDRLGSAEAKELLGEWRAEFVAKGVLVLPGFVNHKSIGKVVEEARRLSSQAYHNTIEGNAYLTSIPEGLPEGHAQTLTDTTALGVVAYDQFSTDSLIRQIYESQEVLRFSEEIIGRGRLYNYDCSLGALNLAVMKEDDYLRWHFDLSDFVVSIALQNADEGGAFEYVSKIRSEDDPQFDRVKRLLEGDRSEVEVLDAAPGSLILFEGRYTIHRVSKIKGSTVRLGALLGYADKPGVCSSEYLKKIRYGRSD